jgi:hypothetical protein
MAKVYGYARHFLDAKSREQLSVQIQKEQIEAYRLRALRDEAWIDYFVDSSLSYSIPFLDRKAGGALNSVLERGDHIVITHLVCAFASGSDFIRTMGYWESRGVHVHLLQININTANQINLAAMRLYPWIEQQLRELDSAHMRDSQIQRISRTKAAGFHACGPAPLGFKVVGPKGKRKVVPDHNERDVCKLIRNLNQGIGTRNGQRFSPREIYFILWKNKVVTKYGREWGIKRIKAAIALAEALTKG